MPAESWCGAQSTVWATSSSNVSASSSRTSTGRPKLIEFDPRHEKPRDSPGAGRTWTPASTAIAGLRSTPNSRRSKREFVMSSAMVALPVRFARMLTPSPSESQGTGSALTPAPRPVDRRSWMAAGASFSPVTARNVSARGSRCSRTRVVFPTRRRPYNATSSAPGDASIALSVYFSRSRPVSIGAPS